MDNSKLESLLLQSNISKKPLQALLVEFRNYLNITQDKNLYAAESFLYDAIECLNDFHDLCEAKLEEK